MEPSFLFSVDVEDFPVIHEGAQAWAGRVRELTDRFLALLDRHGMKATFFVLGQAADRDPGVVRAILERGHEVACHGYAHVTLDKQSPVEFRDDVRRALDALARAGAQRVAGYRAPFLSIQRSTSWAYGVLEELSFKYSSSVIPRYNPSFCWPGFGHRPRRLGALWELPVTLVPGFPVGLPMAGGVYFRSLPFALISKLFERQRTRGEPITGYLHPYDLDWQSESRQCSWLVGKPFSNFFMFYNRRAALPRLDQVIEKGFRVVPYREYVANSLETG